MLFNLQKAMEKRVKDEKKEEREFLKIFKSIAVCYVLKWWQYVLISKEERYKLADVYSSINGINNRYFVGGKVWKTIRIHLNYYNIGRESFFLYIFT